MGICWKRRMRKRRVHRQGMTVLLLMLRLGPLLIVRKKELLGVLGWRVLRTWKLSIRIRKQWLLVCLNLMVLPRKVWILNLIRWLMWKNSRVLEGARGWLIKVVLETWLKDIWLNKI